MARPRTRAHTHTHTRKQKETCAMLQHKSKNQVHSRSPSCPCTHLSSGHAASLACHCSLALELKLASENLCMNSSYRNCWRRDKGQRTWLPTSPASPLILCGNCEVLAGCQVQTAHISPKFPAALLPGNNVLVLVRQLALHFTLQPDTSKAFCLVAVDPLQKV